MPRRDPVRLAWGAKATPTPGPREVGFRTVEVVERHGADLEVSLPASMDRLVWGDNLPAMQGLLAQGYAGKVDLAYADPPYLSQADRLHRLVLDGGGMDPPKVVERLAYRDTWPGGMADYLGMLHPRLLLMRELLSERGSLVVHVDWRASPYVRVLLDEVFGPRNLRNHLVWNKGARGTRSQRGFQHAHDDLWWYSKSDAYTWNQPHEPYKDEGRRRYNRVDADGRRHALVKRRRADGTVYYGRTYPGAQGKWRNDVISDVATMSATSGERAGYGTQKPEALLEILVGALSGEGGLVADFFCGSGTTLAVAARLGRRWLGADSSPVGIQVARNRLVRQGAAPFVVQRVGDGPPGPAAAPRAQPRLDLGAVQTRPAGPGLHAVTLALGRHWPARPDALAAGRPATALIDSWSVDWDHDGRTFRGRWHAVRGNGKAGKAVAALAGTTLRAGRHYVVAVRVVDVFGDECMAVTSVDLR